MSFINKPDHLRDLTICIISFISTFQIISAVKRDPNIFFRIASSVTDTAAVNPNRVKTPSC